MRSEREPAGGSQSRSSLDRAGGWAFYFRPSEKQGRETKADAQRHRRQRATPRPRVAPNAQRATVATRPDAGQRSQGLVEVRRGFGPRVAGAGGEPVSGCRLPVLLGAPRLEDDLARRSPPSFGPRVAPDPQRAAVAAGRHDGHAATGLVGLPRGTRSRVAYLGCGPGAWNRMPVLCRPTRREVQLARGPLSGACTPVASDQERRAAGIGRHAELEAPGLVEMPGGARSPVADLALRAGHLRERVPVLFETPARQGPLALRRVPDARTPVASDTEWDSAPHPSLARKHEAGVVEMPQGARPRVGGGRVRTGAGRHRLPILPGAAGLGHQLAGEAFPRARPSVAPHEERKLAARGRDLRQLAAGLLAVRVGSQLGGESWRTDRAGDGLPDLLRAEPPTAKAEAQRSPVPDATPGVATGAPRVRLGHAIDWPARSRVSASSAIARPRAVHCRIRCAKRTQRSPAVIGGHRLPETCLPTAVHGRGRGVATRNSSAA
jgi:hypothetical protein